MATQRIERILRHDGIVAVAELRLNGDDTDVSWAGEERWRPLLVEAARLRKLSTEASVRVLVGEHALLVCGDDRQAIGVVFLKGHPVVKSVVRMIRQLLRQPNAVPQAY